MRQAFRSLHAQSLVEVLKFAGEGAYCIRKRNGKKGDKPFVRLMFGRYTEVLRSEGDRTCCFRKEA